MAAIAGTTRYVPRSFGLPMKPVVRIRCGRRGSTAHGYQTPVDCRRARVALMVAGTKTIASAANPRRAARITTAVKNAAKQTAVSGFQRLGIGRNDANVETAVQAAAASAMSTAELRVRKTRPISSLNNAPAAPA